ncbi:uncharacterized protein [Dermacentor andersoni]|uniref:uncharacterized protein isoform X1 n=1 Tax=Dermacentor andersoni TaxID=34620 RepID=UPI0021552692|nr:uncharacterized protein LOC126531029 [Dermacentor andersoni]XP_050034355.1 uncharacterized protein LOC126531029 [Dermacentor andersoni]
MSESTLPTRPRRKQAVPLKYEGSGDDSDDDLPSDILDIDFTPTPRSASSNNSQARQRRSQGQKRLLVKLKIKKSGSKGAYVERADDEDFSPRAARAQKRRKKRTPSTKKSSSYSRKSTKSKAQTSSASKGYESSHTPKGLKKQIVTYARANTVDQAAKKFRVPVHKVKHWMKADQTVAPPTSKPEVRNTCNIPDPFPASFKLFSIGVAEEKSVKEASILLSLDESLMEYWIKGKLEITRKVNSGNIPQWETDVFVGVRRDALAGHEISVSDLMFRAESLKVDDTKVDLQWAQRWCERFGVLFKGTSRLSGSKELNEVTLLQLPPEMTCFTPYVRPPAKESSPAAPPSPPPASPPPSPPTPPPATRQRRTRFRGASEIDLELWAWYKKMQKKGRKLTKAIVCARAQRLFQKHGHPEFRAGDGWHRAWKRRCEQMNPQDLSVDEEDVDVEDESSTTSHGHTESQDVPSEKPDAALAPAEAQSHEKHQQPAATDQQQVAVDQLVAATAMSAEPQAMPAHHPVLHTAVPDRPVHEPPASETHAVPDTHAKCATPSSQSLHSAVVPSHHMHPVTTSVQPPREMVNTLITTSPQPPRGMVHASQQLSPHLLPPSLDRSSGHGATLCNPHYTPLCGQSQQHGQHAGPPYPTPDMGLDSQRLSRPFYQLHQMTPPPVQNSHMFYGSYWTDQTHMRGNETHKNDNRQPVAPPFYDSYANYDHGMTPACSLEVSNQPYTDYGQSSSAPPAAESSNSNSSSAAAAAAQKKKNERYLPDFKLQVVKFALQSTFKKTAEHFGVHHSTVAEWCRDREKLERLFPHEKGSLVKSTETATVSPAEQMFVTWLTDCNATNAKLDAAQVKDKVKEIIRYFGEDQVKTNCRWLYVWHKKRLEMEQMIEDLPELQSSSGKEFRIAFPPAVKLEIVKVAERLKFSEASKYFQIDRNSLSDWSKTQEKLKAMVKEGKVRKKEVSKSKKALEAEKEVYQWYQQCRSSGFKPGPNEVRAKAAETYRKYGDTTMKCSIGWYSRWSRRFGIQLRYEKDDEILEWVLAQLEQNRSVTHNEIQTQAIATLSQTRAGFKCSAGWPIRFCKRHQALLQKMPTLDTPLPAVLEEKISSFRLEVQRLQEQCGVTSAAIGAMDEVPLYFSSGAGGGTGTGSLLVRRCGFEQSQAIVFLACLSDGGVLPPLAVLKGSSSVSEVNGMFVLCQEEMKVDRNTVEYWAERVWGRFVPSPSFLILDSFEPHKQFAASAGSDIKVAITPPACSSQTHPVVVWLRRKFQALVNKMSVDRGSSRSIPTVQEMLECIAAAWRHLQATSHDAVQKSFAVTGALLTGDPDEDDMIGRADLLPDVDEEDFT